MADGYCDGCGSGLWKDVAAIRRTPYGAVYCSVRCQDDREHQMDLRDKENRQFTGMPGGPPYSSTTVDEGGGAR